MSSEFGKVQISIQDTIKFFSSSTIVTFMFPFFRWLGGGGQNRCTNLITNVYTQIHKEVFPSQSHSKKEKFSWCMGTEGKGWLIYADVLH